MYDRRAKRPNSSITKSWQNEKRCNSTGIKPKSKNAEIRKKAATKILYV